MKLQHTKKCTLITIHSVVRLISQLHRVCMHRIQKACIVMKDLRLFSTKTSENKPTSRGRETYMCIPQISICGLVTGEGVCHSRPEEGPIRWKCEQVVQGQTVCLCKCKKIQIDHGVGSKKMDQFSNEQQLCSCLFVVRYLFPQLFNNKNKYFMFLLLGLGEILNK